MKRSVMMNRMTTQRYILLGSLIVILGGMVLLFSTPSQKVEDSVQEDGLGQTLPNHAPEGYKVPQRPAVVFPYTHISADRLRLANIQEVSDGEWRKLVLIQPADFSLGSPDGQWEFSLDPNSSDITIIRTDGSGETRMLVKDDVNSDRGSIYNSYGSSPPIWSWDSSRIFYRMSRIYRLDSGTRERERWVESVDIDTGEITRHTDIGFSDNVHSFATARYPDDPVIYHDRENRIVSAGTRDGSARWVIGHKIGRGSLSFDKKILVTVGGGRTLLYATDGSGLLHSILLNADDLSLSPDGTKIAYHDIEKRESGTGFPLISDIYLVNIDGTGKTKITNTPDIPETVIGWTPDGKLIFRVTRIGLYSADLVAE